MSQTTDVTKPGAPEAESKHLKDHLLEYPLVTSARDASLSLPLAGKIVATVAPMTNGFRNTQPFKLVFDAGDKIGIAALNKLDQTVPSVKTLKVEDITGLVTKRTNTVVTDIKAKDAKMKDAIKTNVVEPSQENWTTITTTIHDMLHTKDGACAITSQADPLVKPVNEKLESFVAGHFPNVKQVPHDKKYSELSRTARIFYNLFTWAPKEAKDKIVNEVKAAEKKSETIATKVSEELKK